MGYLAAVNLLLGILFGTDLTGLILNLVGLGPQDSLSSIESGRIAEFRIQQSRYGTPIFMNFGTGRVSGNIIWASDVSEVEETTESCTMSGGGLLDTFATESCVTTTTYYYYQSFAIALCKGPAFAIRRIWADGRLILDLTETNLAEARVLIEPVIVPGSGPEDDDVFAGGDTEARRATDYFNFHFGGANQIKDDMMVAMDGDDITPLYRDLVYITFRDVLLRPFSNRIPNVSVELISVDNSIALNLIASTTGSYTAGEVWLPAELGPYFYAKSATDWFVFNKVSGDLIFQYPFTGTNSIISPIGDRFGQMYSSQKFNGTDSELIQYGITSGRILARYGFEAPSEPIKSIDFDYKFKRIVAVSDTGEYDFPIHPIITNPVVRDLTSYVPYTNNGSNGTTGKDIVITQDGYKYVLRADSANPKLSYLTKYTSGSRVASAIIGPLSHANHVNSIDSSINFEDADYLVTSGRYLLIGGSTGGYIAKFDTANDTVVEYNGSVTISIADKANMNVHTAEIRLTSGDVLNFTDLTLNRTINYADYDTLAHSTFTTVLYIAAINGYYFDDSTDGFIGLERFFATSHPLEDVVNDLILTYQPENRPAIKLGDINTTQLTTEDMQGMVVITQKSIRAQLNPVAQAFFFDGVESDGQIKFVVRGGGSTYNITEADVAAEYPGNTHLPIKVSRIQESEQLKEVTVDYPDADLDYLGSTQRSRRIRTSAITLVTKHIPITMSAARAFRVAQFLLESTWVGRETYEFTLLPKFADMEPTDIATITLDSGTVFISRIQSIEQTDKGLLRVEAMAEESAVYVDVNDAVRDSGATQFEPATLLNQDTYVLGAYDIPYLTDEIGQISTTTGTIVQYAAGTV